MTSTTVKKNSKNKIAPLPSPPTRIIYYAYGADCIEGHYTITCCYDKYKGLDVSMLTNRSELTIVRVPSQYLIEDPEIVAKELHMYMENNYKNGLSSGSYREIREYIINGIQCVIRYYTQPKR